MRKTSPKEGLSSQAGNVERAMQECGEMYSRDSEKALRLDYAWCV